VPIKARAVLPPASRQAAYKGVIINGFSGEAARAISLKKAGPFAVSPFIQIFEYKFKKQN
jgi:hypothetical protein